MEKKIGVIFTKIPGKEWKAFKTACVQAGKPMTEVLWRGAQLYLKTKSVYLDPPYMAKEGREDNEI